jgi:hypothetical protein
MHVFGSMDGEVAASVASNPLHYIEVSGQNQSQAHLRQCTWECQSVSG